MDERRTHVFCMRACCVRECVFTRNNKHNLVVTRAYVCVRQRSTYNRAYLKLKRFNFDGLITATRAPLLFRQNRADRKRLPNSSLNCVTKTHARTCEAIKRVPKHTHTHTRTRQCSHRILGSMQTRSGAAGRFRFHRNNACIRWGFDPACTYRHFTRAFASHIKVHLICTVLMSPASSTAFEQNVLDAVW